MAFSNIILIPEWIQKAIVISKPFIGSLEKTKKCSDASE